MTKLKELKKQYPPAEVGKPKRKPTKDKAFNVRLPDELIGEMAVRAAQKRTTIRAVILESLAKNGFNIDQNEMVDKRK